jgi:hypothetical protein
MVSGKDHLSPLGIRCDHDVPRHEVLRRALVEQLPDGTKIPYPCTPGDHRGPRHGVPACCAVEQSTRDAQVPSAHVHAFLTKASHSHPALTTCTWTCSPVAPEPMAAHARSTNGWVSLSGLTPPFRAMRAYRATASRGALLCAAPRIRVLHIFAQQGGTTFSRSRNSSLGKLVQTGRQRQKSTLVRAAAWAASRGGQDAVKQLVMEVAAAALSHRLWKQR